MHDLRDGQAPVAIREICPADAAAVATLSGELGYPATPGKIEERLQSRPAGHITFVACDKGKVVGWIDVAISHHLQSDPTGEIGGLVVASEYRSLGVGAALLEHAEQWIRDQGLSSVVVRSQVKREDAHRFYLREGYSRTKTSAVFSKSLI